MSPFLRAESAFTGPLRRRGEFRRRAPPAITSPSLAPSIITTTATATLPRSTFS